MAIKIIVVWGQSNSDGRVTLERSTPGFLEGAVASGVKVWNGTAIVDYDLTDFGPTGNGTCFATGSGSENCWAHDLVAANKLSQYYDEDIVLCKVTNGSSPIVFFNTASGCWNSDYGGIPGTTPHLLELLNARFDSLISYCNTNAIAYEVLFIMGKQGEADKNISGGPAQYQTHYSEVIATIRDFTGIPTLHNFVSTIGVNSLGFDSTIDTAMRTIAATDPNATLIDLANATFIGDDLHDDEVTSSRHGNLIANAWIQMANLLPPDPVGSVIRFPHCNFILSAGKSFITNNLSREFVIAGQFTEGLNIRYIDACARAIIDNGLEDMCIALYPLVGGTADKHKLNLMNPEDTNAAHRIIWGGTVTHSSGGSQGNGTTGYGDTNIAGTALDNDAAYYYYSRTDLNNTSIDFGVERASAPNSRIWARARNGNVFDSRIWQSGTSVSFANTDSRGGFWGGRRTSTAVQYAGKNAGAETTSANANSGVIGNNINIMCLFNGIGGTRSLFSARQYAFFSFFRGEISAATFQALHNSIQAAQTILGRNV